MVQGNYHRRTRFVTRSTCITRLVTHSTRSTRLPTRCTRLSIRSAHLSTRSTHLSIHLPIGSICMSTRSARSTIDRPFCN